MKELGRDVKDVFGITMPCFGTSNRTYNNALKLMESLGISTKEINIEASVSKHFEDIGHDGKTLDLTYENSQARERTQVLMDFASLVGGITIGTGDLSELALGWCTYNGDQMSMYSVNSGIPKTMLFYIIDALIKVDYFPNSNDVLKDIINTPISPELLPPDKLGEIKQKTEDVVGPYILHDFYIYYALKFGFTPTKIYQLAQIAFKGEFDNAIIKKWLVNFYKRFISQQFKRRPSPDGISVGSIGLSPHGELVMPSDASFALWLTEAENL